MTLSSPATPPVRWLAPVIALALGPWAPAHAAAAEPLPETAAPIQPAPIQPAPAPPSPVTAAPAPTQPAPASAGSVTVAAPPSEPSAELVARNRALTERMHRGERMMIGGRVGAGVAGGVFLTPGLGLLIVGIIVDRPGTAGIGAALTAVGVTGVVVSSVFAVRGFREVQAARAGRLSLWGSPSLVGLRWSTRF